MRASRRGPAHAGPRLFWRNCSAISALRDLKLLGEKQQGSPIGGGERRSATSLTFENKPRSQTESLWGQKSGERSRGNSARGNRSRSNVSKQSVEIGSRDADWPAPKTNIQTTVRWRPVSLTLTHSKTKKKKPCNYKREGGKRGSTNLSRWALEMTFGQCDFTLAAKIKTEEKANEKSPAPDQKKQERKIKRKKAQK